MSVGIILEVVRRTITLPESIDARIRNTANEDESFSAAITRLVEAGLAEAPPGLDYIGSGESGDADLAFRVEEILAELAAGADPDD